MSRAEADRTSAIRALTLGPRVVMSPVSAYTTQRAGHHPALTLAGVVMLTTGAAAASHPVLMHMLRTTPQIAASADLAAAFVFVQSFVLTPVGTAAFLLTMALIVWALALLFGTNLTFRQAGFVVFAAGIVGALKRVFAAAVLYVRWWLRPSILNSEITTGLDAFLAPAVTKSFPYSILSQGGVFEIWFLILVAVGLEYGSQLPRQTAVAITGCSGVVFIGARVILAALDVT